MAASQKNVAVRFLNFRKNMITTMITP